MPKDSEIEIRLGTSFNFSPIVNSLLKKNLDYYVSRGLNDKSNSDELMINHDNAKKTIMISNYQEVQKPDEIVICLFLKTPTSAGPTTPFQIRSYNNLADGTTKEIDMDLSQATINIQDISFPTSYGYLPASLEANGELIPYIEFQITSSQMIPENGWIVIIVDQDLVIKEVLPINCIIENNGFLESSPNCYKRDRTINIQLKEAYSLGVQKSFKLEKVIESPLTADHYYFEIKTYDENKETIRETYTQRLEFKSKQLAEFLPGQPTVIMRPEYCGEKSF